MKGTGRRKKGKQRPPAPSPPVFNRGGPVFHKALFRPDEVAALMNCSKRTIYRMLRDGRLPREHRPLRVPRAAVVGLLKKVGHQAGAPGAEE